MAGVGVCSVYSREQNNEAETGSRLVAAKPPATRASPSREWRSLKAEVAGQWRHVGIYNIFCGRREENNNRLPRT